MTPQSSKAKGNCRRCKQEYIRTNLSSRICPECKSKCSSCGVSLTIENQNTSSLLFRSNYICKSCVAKSVRESRDKDAQKDYDFRRHYGISKEDRDLMEQTQQGTCAICKTKTQKLHVDHSHSTGKVRGLLCPSCNKGLGHFKDNQNIIEQAIKYLEATR